MKALRPKFSNTNYDLFKNNCNHFTEAVSQALLGKSIPDEIISLPMDFMNSPLGASLMPIVTQMSDSFKIKSNSLFDERGKAKSLKIHKTAAEEKAYT